MRWASLNVRLSSAGGREGKHSCCSGFSWSPSSEGTQTHSGGYVGCQTRFKLFLAARKCKSETLACVWSV